MKRILAAVLALSTLTLAGGVMQAKVQSSTPEPAPKKSNKPPKQAVLSGKLDDTGTIFIADSDLKSWKVNNPDAVKDHRSERVTIRALQDFRTGSVTVRSVRRRNVTISNTPN